MTPDLTVTDHAKSRSKQRLGIPLRAIQRHVEKAMEFGMNAEEFHGNVKRYLMSKVHAEDEARPKYWQGMIFVFSKDGERLITVYAPNNTSKDDLIKQARRFYTGDAK